MELCELESLKYISLISHLRHFFSQINDTFITQGIDEFIVNDLDDPSRSSFCVDRYLDTALTCNMWSTYIRNK